MRGPDRVAAAARWLPALCLAGGLVLAGPPAARWVERVYTEWHSKAEWGQVRAATTPPAPGDPVARLVIPGAGLAHNVRRGSNEETLKQGPGLHGLMSASRKLVLGHRDTHFNALKKARTGMEVLWYTRGGKQRYRLQDMDVLTPELARRRLDSFRERDCLVLLTCYPFHYIGPAPKRLVIFCTPED